MNFFTVDELKPTSEARGSLENQLFCTGFQIHLRSLHLKTLAASLFKFMPHRRLLGAAQYQPAQAVGY